MSDKDRWSRADGIFDQALDLPEGRRQAFVEQACAGDPELRALVERLLASSSAEDALLDGQGISGPIVQELAGDLDPAAAASEGTRVGRYRVLSEIGRGGMAVVYLAERADGEFEQRVALKLLRRGIDTDDVVRRFAQERQILALARHPSIARLLDGGATEDGRPFLAMEYVEGLPIDRYCEEHGLALEARLRLFVQIARAVAYAHRNLVVHRDIKPSNILVTDDGEVKLLDFGIAKLLDPDDAGEGHTRTQARFLTPAYASPEQISGAPVTTASDIYQLGLLLFRLLTGRWPYRVDPDDPEGARRAICETPPTRPSVAVSQPLETPGTRPAAGATATGTGSPDAGPTSTTGDAGRGTAQLRRRLRGDLDNIVLMALRKEPERRYGTVERLIEDLERYLEGRPVSARPDVFGYRMRKFVGRHRAASLLGAAALALLVAFAVTMTVQTRRIARALDRAELEAASASEISDFLMSLFREPDPVMARGETITAREILDRGAERIEKDLADQPEVQGRLMRTIANVYDMLGLGERAVALAERAVELHTAALGDDDLETASSKSVLGGALNATGQLERAEAVLGEVYAVRAAKLGPEHEDTLSTANVLGYVRAKLGRVDEGEAMLSSAVEVGRRRFGLGHAGTMGAMLNLASVYQMQGRLEEAGTLLETILETQRGALGEDHPDTLKTINNLAINRARQRRLDEAEPLFREALAIHRKVHGPEHKATVASLSNLANCLQFEGRDEEAAALFREALEIQERVLGVDHPDTLVTVENSGILADKMGRTDEAEALFRRVIQAYRRTRGPDFVGIAVPLYNLGNLLNREGRRPEAVDALETAVRIFRNTHGDTHPRTVTMKEGLAVALRDSGRLDEAEALLLEVLAAESGARGEGDPEAQDTVDKLVRLYEAMGEPEKAEAMRGRLVPAAE